MLDWIKYSDFNWVVEIDNIQYEEEGMYECIVKRKSFVVFKEVVLVIECMLKLLYYLFYMFVKQVCVKYCVGKRKIVSLFEDIVFFLMILYFCCMKLWIILVLFEVKF